ncbi:MAG TPA: S1C family serine protease [Thermoleophilaceae bacterium]|nr:S1C family serine protease [Thermoleophilaceae bacterium]
MAVLEELQQVISTSAERHGPSVVGLGRGWGLGSGTIIGKDQVLTNAHNLRREEVVVTFSDGTRETGAVGGVDADLDLAVIKVRTNGRPPLEWGDPGEPGIGSPVLALGNPGGRGLRVTLGFVSSGPRSFRGPRGRRVAGAIEHTAALPRGSSGGPLLSADGGLIGINAIRTDGNLILALPVAALRERVEALARGEAKDTPRLGVAVAPPRVARRMRRAVGLPERDGLLVRGVEDGSPAAGAGIERGDLIAAAGERPLTSVDALYAALDGLPEHGKLPLTVVRGTDERELEVSLR